MIVVKGGNTSLEFSDSFLAKPKRENRKKSLENTLSTKVNAVLQRKKGSINVLNFQIKYSTPLPVFFFFFSN